MQAPSSEMQVKRTYIGHSEGIRAIKMSNTGSHFLSTGFDLYNRYWDVETGQAAGTYSNRKMAYDVKFYPRYSSRAATTINLSMGHKNWANMPGIQSSPPAM